MKATLIVLAILAFQFAVAVFLGKCIRAGRGPSVRPPQRDARPHRPLQDVTVQPRPPVPNVVPV